MRLIDELRTRLVPIERVEGTYARNRPADERPPYPRAGWQVWYRRNEWDSVDDLHLMRIVDVQDPNDQTSDWAPNLWQTLRDNRLGHVLRDRAGEPLIVPVADPWPWVHLRWEGDTPKGTEHAWKNNVQMTWESRVRGSAGWLPIDYERTRKVRLPGDLIVQHAPAPDRSRAVNQTLGFPLPPRPGEQWPQSL